MPNDPARRADRAPVKMRRTLADRVKARVAEVATQLDDEVGAAGPSSSQLKPTRLGSGTKAGAQAQRERRSLLRVYFEMKKSYQDYRKQTGKPSVPELREAVQAFTKGPSVTSLVGVAVFLEDRNLLAW